MPPQYAPQPTNKEALIAAVSEAPRSERPVASPKVDMVWEGTAGRPFATRSHKRVTELPTQVPVFCTME